MSIAENIAKVRERIEKACQKADRNTADVELVAVTKVVEVDRIYEAIDAGIQIIGENRVQEAWQKYQSVGDKVQWHLIGHLQTNKVKRALQFARFIHSVDSLHLAEEIQKQAQKMDKTVDILVQVNTSGEQTKFGFAPEESLDAVKYIALLPQVKIKGLMTIGAFLPDPEDVRPCFRQLRRLRDEIRKCQIDRVEMDILSMGMTGDFEVAIEEGSTMIRVGRSIFGKRLN